MGRTGKGLSVLLAVLTVWAGCTTGARQPRAEPVSEPAAQTGLEATGMASWYGEDFHGRRTANGEIYDMQKLTAAHQTLPFNTILEVVNLENGRRTLVRINDRGPFVKNRVIDLSLKAARTLGMEESGTARVSLRAIKTSELNPDWHELDDRRGYCLQAGAFLERGNADRLLQRLAGAIKDLKFGIQTQDGYHRVISDKITSRPEAEQWLRLLDRLGFDGFIRDAD